MRHDLTIQQRLFCDEYLIDRNGQQAAIRAGYSPRSAAAQASRLLKNAKVLTYINKNADKISERLNIDAEYVLKRLIEVDRMDVADILDDDGNIRPVRDWPEVWRTNVSSIDVSEILGGGDPSVVLKKIKWPDKTKNRELLGKHVSIDAFVRNYRVDLGNADGQPLAISDVDRTARLAGLLAMAAKRAESSIDNDGGDNAD